MSMTFEIQKRLYHKVVVLHVRTHLNGNYHQQSSPPGYGGERHPGPQYSPTSYHHHNNHSDSSPGYQYGRFDASALHIAHALKQTELQKSYRMHREKPIDCYLSNCNPEGYGKLTGGI
ncbi:hypothetical protein GEV33_006449 [Tenebrio molitor]|uniref:Uncharacterized protein n=1 Tax=Tenebrio molitor TaxID=7067 RepID=A0A8J6HL69_TENMO|nr:hypothetical protein GEV33_006449 [Tenebrio molitor]